MSSSSKKGVTILALAGLLAVPVPVIGASSASAHGTCRPGTERVSELVASRGVSCATARQVAAAYDAAVMSGGEFPSRKPVAARRFSCRTTTVGHPSEESFTVLCRQGRLTVRFAWGV